MVHLNFCRLYLLRRQYRCFPSEAGCILCSTDNQGRCGFPLRVPEGSAKKTNQKISKTPAVRSYFELQRRRQWDLIPLICRVVKLFTCKRGQTMTRIQPWATSVPDRQIRPTRNKEWASANESWGSPTTFRKAWPTVRRWSIRVAALLMVNSIRTWTPIIGTLRARLRERQTGGPTGAMTLANGGNHLVQTNPSEQDDRIKQVLRGKMDRIRSQG